MPDSQAKPLPCDGCGQLASSEHIARRLQRLEWSTRFRPIHLQTLFLGAATPESDSDFLYNPASKLEGEARALLTAVGIEPAERSAEVVLAEFQRQGCFLSYALECPVNVPVNGGDGLDVSRLIEIRWKNIAARIRRSLKPKRIVLFAQDAQVLLPHLRTDGFGELLLLDDGMPFVFAKEEARGSAERLHSALSGYGKLA